MRVDRYLVVEELGRGGMGVVYSAYDPELDRRVALKLVRVRDADDAHRRRLLREAQALAHVSHPNVVAVYDVGTHDGDVFVAMELIRGRALSQWVEAERPDRKTIIEAMLGAGAGLAAAHEAGLIHRDIKPSNILIGEDGRARLLDFGLARPPDSDDSPTPVSSSQPPLEMMSPFEDETSSGERYLTDPLTRHGTVVGTPAYMAPEQFRREPLDARTDIFSFCAVLYWALYGQRPFSGREFEELRESVCSGRLAEPPADAKVPRHLADAVRRGLSARRDERFANMQALLAELRRDPWRRRRRVAGAALAVGIAAALFGVARATVDTPGARCDSRGEQIEAIWSSAVRESVTKRINASGAGIAPASAARVASLLDGWRQEWASIATASCRALANRVESDLLYERRSQCLQRSRDRISALVAVLDQPIDPQNLSSLVTAVEAAVRLELCAEDEAVLAERPLPESPEARARVAALQARVAAVDAQRLVLNLEEAARMAEGIARDAEELGYAPALADILAVQAAIENTRGRYAEAEALLYRAMRLAGEARDARRLAHTWVELLSLIGNDLKQIERARGLLAGVEAAVSFDGSVPMRSRFLLEHGGFLIEAGAPAEAVPVLERGLEVMRPLYGQTDVEVAVAHTLLGRALTQLGDYSRAEQHLTAARDIFVAEYGRVHYRVAAALTNLAIVAEQQDDLARAEGLYREVLAVDRAIYGDQHPEVARDLNNLAMLLRDAGRYDEALPLMVEALQMRERLLSPGHASIAWSHHSIGSTYRKLGRWADARRSLERALAIREAALGDDHPEVADTESGLAEVACHEGKLEEAERRYRRAADIFAAALGETHLDAGSVASAGANCMMHLRQPQKALPFFERALAGLPEDEPYERAAALFGRAQARWSLGDRSRARSDAARADALLAPLIDPSAAAARELVQAWLENPHGVAGP